MTPAAITSPWARIAILLLAAMWIGTGEYLLWAGRFATTPLRSHQTTVVEGAGAMMMALIFIALGLIALTLFLQSMHVEKLGQTLAITGLLAMTLLLFMVR